MSLVMWKPVEVNVKLTNFYYSATRWCIYTLEMEALSGVL